MNNSALRISLMQLVVTIMKVYCIVDSGESGALLRDR